MNSDQPKKINSDKEYSLNLRIILMLVAVEIFILVTISFVKIYVDKKQSILKRIESEVKILEKSFIRDVEQSLVNFNQIYNLIKHSSESPENITNIFENFSAFGSFSRLYSSFGYYWIGKDGKVIAANRAGYLSKGTDANYLTHVRLSRIDPEKIFYGINPNSTHKITKVLGLASGIKNLDGEYEGTFLLEVDTGMLLQNLENFRHESTNFAIIDERLNVITSYPIRSDNFGVSIDSVDNHDLLNTIKHLKYSYSNKKYSNQMHFQERENDAASLNMISGENYYIRHLINYPFIFIVSFKPEIVRETITKKLFVKFFEILIIASFFLILIIIIYHRETFLRSKAERATQLALKAMNAKSDFLSYAAHEIRSPLGFILTGSEIINKNLLGPWPTQYHDYISGINHNSKLILEFINDILDERHIIMGNFKISEKICEVDAIITKAILTNTTRFHDRKITVKKVIEKDLPSIFVDERRISQALNNLISNSFKYSLDDTEITVVSKMDKDKLCIEVIDQGIGMSEEDIQIALTKYGTVHGENKGNWIESYGLGLQIVQMLLNSHNATLKIKSQINKGTKVTITLPRNRLIWKNSL